jgi:hypothetical protein
MTTNEIKLRIIEAGEKAVQHLIKVAEEDIIGSDESGDLSADRLKNAAMAKKLAVFDAFEILNRIENERDNLNGTPNKNKSIETKQGFAERRSK